MQQIAIIDYGMGNLRSVAKAIEYVAGSHVSVLITSDASAIENADRVIFPGQGAAAACMQALRQASLEDPLRKAFHSKPFLGICMGMQVLMTSSSENEGVDCLGLLSGKAEHFADYVDINQQGLTIPQMGWNNVSQVQEHTLWQGIEEGARFYFAHSYFVAPEDTSLAVGQTHYGISYVSAIAQNNVFVVQFHPEKSAENGLRLLKNFVDWNGVG